MRALWRLLCPVGEADTRGKAVLMSMAKRYVFSPTTRTASSGYSQAAFSPTLRRMELQRLGWGSTGSEWPDWWDSVGLCHRCFQLTGILTSQQLWSRLNAGFGLEENNHAVSLQGSCMEFPPLLMAGSGVCSALYPCELEHGCALSMCMRKCLLSFFAFVFFSLALFNDVRLRHVKAGWGKARACSRVQGRSVMEGNS